jgi:carbonic anhydrase/acetyltransferase-like protein (isoleucine patch superfamily)
MPIYSLDGTEPSFPAEPECWIAPSAVLIGRVRLKREASVWFGAVLKGDDEPIEIGERSNVQENCVLHVDPGYPLTVGDNCTIGHQAMVHGCTIGSNTLIGMHATILNGARIGRNCLIGASALITENKVIPDNSVVMGAPGKVVREVDEAGAQDLVRMATLYVTRWRRYRRGLVLKQGIGAAYSASEAVGMRS